MNRTPITDADLAAFRARIEDESFRIADDEEWFWDTLHRILDRAQRTPRKRRDTDLDLAIKAGAELVKEQNR